MKIKIYNAKIETSYVFQPWEYAQNQFDLNDYDLVGEGDIKFDECLGRNAQLEVLFATFNGRYMCTDTIDISNFKYSGHSLSVSDVIYFVDEKETMADRELLQELVDKETPMPVDKKTVNIFVGNNLYNESWEGYCLRCNSIVKKDFHEEVNYCPHCGQHLNWQQNENEKEE